VSYPPAAGRPEAGNIPAEPNAFVGRERDLADLIAMLEHVRMLTLFGPGGIGKTRLALKLAADLMRDYPGGAWMVDLTDAGGPDRVVSLVAGVLGVRPEPDRPLADTLAEALRGQRLLLVLDTCEHLVQASAELVQRLLSGCPGLRIVATSREALRVRGEVIWRVPPLGLPAADGRAGLTTAALGDYEAVRLFVIRATAVRPGFSLHASNATAVVEICRTLDGVPLAIELAAARVRTLSAEQIRDRLASRFELLAFGDRTAPLRQQTLRATVEWSVDLLTKAERKLLSRLSVFHGWSLEMAEQVCADDQLPASAVLDLLSALIDKSLVIVDAEVGGDGRYRLLDTVRELSAERAEADGELSALRTAHRDCMLALADDIAGRAFLTGEPAWPERVAMYLRVLADRANYAIAIVYCIAHGDADAGLRLCNALSSSWLANGDVADGAAWIDELLAGTPVVPAPAGLRARALAVRSELAFEQQDYAGSARYAAAGFELSRAIEDGNPASALRMQALTLLMAGQLTQATEYADAALAAAAQMRDPWEEGIALAARAAAVAGRGLLDDAQASYEKALAVLSGNNRWGVANVLSGLGQLARARGDATGAVRYFSDALAIYRQIDARPEMARCLGGIGLVALSAADLSTARISLSQSLQLNLATGQRLGIARALTALAVVAAGVGDYDRGVQVAAAAQALFEAIGVQPSSVSRLRSVFDQGRKNLGPAVADASAESGRAMSPRQAAVLAMAPGPPIQAKEPAASTPAPSAPAPSASAASAPGQLADTGNGHGRTAVAAGHAQEPAWPGPLTEREREVARLIAQGLSNRAIGHKLFISQATAARHVANIFSKLGFKARAQLTAWVIRAGAEQPDLAAPRPGP
jgi:predicted ATPase/DNA-binding CsgD family transcriptional regulator/Tfp pilus assembly protein PilF